MRIVVLTGGLSPERNVSLSTGTMVIEALRALSHRAGLIDLYFGPETGGVNEAPLDAPVSEAYKKISHEAPDLGQMRRDRKGNNPSMFGPGMLKLCRMADTIFLALHSTHGENGRVQAASDLMGISYTGAGYLGSAIVMDRDLTKQMVTDVVSTLDWKTVTYITIDIGRLIETARLPLIVKPVASDFSIGVSIAYTAEGLCRSLTEGPALGRHTALEEHIRGREIQVGILEDKTLPSIKIIPKQGFYNYANKYQPGAALETYPTEITPEEGVRVRAATPRVYETLGLSVYSRTDFTLMEDRELRFLETNTLSDMIPTSLLPQEATAAGIDYNELCQRIVCTSLGIRKQGR